MSVERPAGQAVTVVGVDGSPCSLRAFDWAVDGAARGEGSLEIVYVRNRAARPGDLSAARADNLVHGLVDRARAAGVPAVGAVALGVPGEVLVGRSIDAAQLVLGATGHRTRGGLLLGEVAQHCARHARCPVVLVPAHSWPRLRQSAARRSAADSPVRDQGPLRLGLSAASATG